MRISTDFGHFLSNVKLRVPGIQAQAPRICHSWVSKFRFCDNNLIDMGVNSIDVSHHHVLRRDYGGKECIHFDDGQIEPQCDMIMNRFGGAHEEIKSTLDERAPPRRMSRSMHRGRGHDSALQIANSKTYASIVSKPYSLPEIGFVMLLRTKSAREASIGGEISPRS